MRESWLPASAALARTATSLRTMAPLGGASSASAGGLASWTIARATGGEASPAPS